MAERHWIYWRGGRSGEVECGFWAGSRPPNQALHFHPEAQVTAVISGSRHFQIGGQAWVVRAGQCLLIPARLAHRSLDRAGPDTRCLNLYAAIPEARETAIIDMARFGWTDSQALVAAIRRLLGAPEAGSSTEAQGSGWECMSDRPIGEIAAGQGLTREAYTRRFSRVVGMPPHAYRLILRLNAARRALAEGAPVAEIATLYGFTDQSHFGRHFRRAFGTTPRAYGDGMRITNIPDLSGFGR